MSNSNFSTTIEVPQSPEEVYNAITHVPKWWSRDYSGQSSRLNDEFIIHHPNQHYSKQKLIEVTPGKKVIWLVTESNLNWIKDNKAEWTNTKMIFEINTEGNKTLLHFIHEGLTPEKECYAMCQRGWSMIIRDWLYHYITTGVSSEEMNKAAEIRKQLLEDKQ